MNVKTRRMCTFTFAMVSNTLIIYHPDLTLCPKLTHVCAHLSLTHACAHLSLTHVCAHLSLTRRPIHVKLLKTVSGLTKEQVAVYVQCCQRALVHSDGATETREGGVWAKERRELDRSGFARTYIPQDTNT